MLVVYMVGVTPLLSENRRLSHLGIHIPVLSVVFPKPWPARVAAGVECRVERPRDIGGAGLVGGDFAGQAGKLPIKSRGNRYRLREERSVADVGRPVDMVKSVECRYAHYFQ